MFVYKKLKGSDIALVPFNTHKQFAFVWGGTYDHPLISNQIMGKKFGSGCQIFEAEYTQSQISQLKDPDTGQLHQAGYQPKHLLWSQLQHLYYGNNSGQSMNGSYPFNISGKFGEIDIQNSDRYLDRKALVISIPQKYYGSQIKPGSFSYSKNKTFSSVGEINVSRQNMCFDDGKGNLLDFQTMADVLYQDGVPSNSVLQADNGVTSISDQNPFTAKSLIEGNHPSASIDLSRLLDPKNRLFSIYPKHAYKKTRLDLDEYGNKLVNMPRNHITPEDGTYEYRSHIRTGNPFHQGSIFQTYGFDRWNGLRGDIKYVITGNEVRQTFTLGPNSAPRLYSEEFVYDDSYYRNLLNYESIWFEDYLLEDETGDGEATHNYVGCQKAFPITAMNFIANHNNNCTGSQIMSPHNEKFNFNLEDDFSITFHVKMPRYTGSMARNTDPLTVEDQPYVVTGPTEGPYGRQYIIGKSTTKTTVGPPQETSTGGVINLSKTGSASEVTESSSPQFPFEIYIDADNKTSGPNKPGTARSVGGSYAFVFAMSDGINTVTASCAPMDDFFDQWQHVTAVYEGVKSGSEGRLSITTTGKTGEGGTLEADSYTNSHPDNLRGLPVLKNPLQNNANIYIGCKGGSDFGTPGEAINHAHTNPSSSLEKLIHGTYMESGSFFEGSLFGIDIWNYALHPSESKALAHMFTYGATKYIGNIFYNHGIAVITNPQYLESTNHNPVLADLTASQVGEGGIPLDWEHGRNGHCPSYRFDNNYTSSVVFQGTHTIYENEYQCTVQEDEMNYSTNVTTRKIPSEEGQEIADFTTSSIFQPYITTVGLYNEENELLVVGKLGQPVRTSNETDTTFVLRWDT